MSTAPSAAPIKSKEVEDFSDLAEYEETAEQTSAAKKETEQKKFVLF